jgi:hypothetical protein
LAMHLTKLFALTKLFTWRGHRAEKVGVIPIRKRNVRTPPYRKRRMHSSIDDTVGLAGRGNGKQK